LSATLITVAGIGSRHSLDDAIGLLLVEALGEVSEETPETVRLELWEDADALTLVHRLLESNCPTLIVDCADMGLSAGAWHCLSVEPITEMKVVPHSRSISTHGLGLAEALAIARELGLTEPVHVFAVQPFLLQCESSADSGLSEAMQSCFPQLLAALRANIDTLHRRMPQEV